MTSPAPMLLVCVLFFRGSRWATRSAIALALFHIVALVIRMQLARGTFVGQLPWPQSIVFCAAQTFYLPGSVVLAIAAALVRPATSR